MEPACGAGHMAKVLKEYFWQVQSTDAHQYGYAQQRDFLTHPYETNAVDWVITNPQFRLAEEFVLRALRLARHGVAILARTVFLESVGRYGGVSPPANASATIRDAKRLGVGRERSPGLTRPTRATSKGQAVAVA